MCNETSKSGTIIPMNKSNGSKQIWLWVAIIIGVLLVSWALLTADLSRNVRFGVAILGGIMIVVGLNPQHQKGHKEN